MAIGRYFPFPIDLSPAILMEGTSEVQQALDHFEASSSFLFIQRELFNILLSKRILRHMEKRHKVKLVMEFDTRDLVVVRKQVNSIRKDGIAHKLLLKQRDHTYS